jgi:hypothetical protein
VFEDFVAVVDLATGELLRRYSILEALENSRYRHFVSDLGRPARLAIDFRVSTRSESITSVESIGSPPP